MTLMEAILQVYPTTNKGQILVCAASNSATYHIIERLIGNTTSRVYQNVPFKCPPRKAMLRYRIIIPIANSYGRETVVVLAGDRKQLGNQQRPNYLPMEVCKIVEGQRHSKRLNERQITALLKVTCQHPHESEPEIAQIAQTVHHNVYHNDPYAKELGIKTSEKLASVEASILPATWLKYHDTGKEKDCLPQVGQRNVTNKDPYWENKQLLWHFYDNS